MSAIVKKYGFTPSISTALMWYISQFEGNLASGNIAC